jgi:hypothetical protein
MCAHLPCASVARTLAGKSLFRAPLHSVCLHIGGVGALSTPRQGSVGDLTESARLLFGCRADMVSRCAHIVNVRPTDMRLALRVLQTPLALHGWPSHSYYILRRHRAAVVSQCAPPVCSTNVRQCAIYALDPPSPLSALDPRHTSVRGGNLQVRAGLLTSTSP